MLERPEPLFTLFDRHPVVVVGMQDKRGRLYVLCIPQRRAVPVKIEFLEDVATEIRRVTISTIARAIVRNKVGNTAQSNCRLETIRMADNPVSHKPAIAAARHAQAVRIDPR